MDNRYQKKIYRVIKIELLVFTALCALNAMLMPFNGEKFLEFSIALPFFHCPVIWAILMASGAFFLGKGSNTYIETKYPHIWKALHPMGRYSHNSTAFFCLVRGKYDDGSDPVLNSIKENFKTGQLLIIWAFVLAGLSPLLNILIVFLSWDFQ